MGQRINRAAPEAAAKIAPVVGLFFEEPERRIVGIVFPRNAEALNVFADRPDGTKKFHLLDGKRANGKADRRAFLQHEQRVEQRDRVFAPGYGYGNTVAFANHIEAMYRFADLPQQGLLDIHVTKIAL